MTVTKRLVLFLSVCALSSVYALEQSTPYILTDFPITLIVPDSAIWIKWTGATRNPLDPNLVPDSGRIYFSRSPGGSIVENYTDSVTKRVIDTVIDELDTSYISQNNILFSGGTPQRGIKFRPSDNGMSAGIYYIMVAWQTKIGLADTTFYSNEIQLIVESEDPVEITAPAIGDTIEDLTPTFQWEVNAGVPYYHIIVSDEKIAVDLDSESIEGLSIVWEAITANTQITYGAPDPSGTITTDPPPLSPSQEYSWAVLNNYGNHPAYSSTRFSLPSSFMIAGVPLEEPVNVWIYDTDTLNATDHDSITLKWTNLDTNANTYKIYIYVGSDFEGVNAQMIVWSSEVTAGQFTGDTASVDLYAKAILTNNYYTWKVIAVDDKGAGTAGEVTGFRYNAPVGTITVLTKEQIAVGDSVLVKSVGLAEVQVEVLDGSLEAPLLFYTDDDGYLSRERPVGTYRLTVEKDGFESQTKTVTISDGLTSTATFYLERPDATVFGKVLDEAGKAINLAQVVGVSDRGDTISTETDPLGNFILSCYEADWSVSAQKTGYITSLARDTSVTYGQSVNLGTPIVLEKSPYTLSGVVKNSSGSPILGANVKLLLEGVTVGEVPSTAQNGTFSFSIESGTYTLKVTKVGFTSYNSSVEVLNSKSVTVTLQSGAALITGSIIGRSWNDTYTQIFAPITSASVLLLDTTVTPVDTISGTSDRVYGSFSISATGGKTYKMLASKKGYISQSAGKLVVTEPGRTHTVSDTLYAYATIRGTVRMSDTASSNASGVTVNIIDTTTNSVIASATSDALGTFEMQNVPNGVHYRMQAGGNGLITDTIALVDTSGNVVVTDLFMVSDGLAKVNTINTVVNTVTITMETGAKALQWVLTHGTAQVTDAAIKLQSPILKTVSATSVVSGVGTGTYIMVVDADADSLLDCSYHTYTIPISVDSLHTDSVFLPIAHTAGDSLPMSNDSVTIQFTVTGATITSGSIYFKDITAQTYTTASCSLDTTVGTVSTYACKIKPPKDGSYLQYYFKIAIGNNIYGYTQETYRSYIKPDTTVLSRIAVTPSSEGDTLLFPADAEITFDFDGYYGSKFRSATQVSAANVVWSLPVSGGCTMGAQAKNVAITTPKNGTGTTVSVLQAAFQETAAYRLAAGVAGTVLVYFRVTSYTLDSIYVKRVDSDERGYITTSSLDKAEFTAEGIDENGSVVTISPAWEMQPDSVGTIDASGVFRPYDSFVGYVWITATVGNIAGEFNRLADEDINKSGLAVHYVVPAARDTVRSNLGCQVVIPDNLIDAGVDAEIRMERPVVTKNKVRHISGNFDVITDAFDFEELKNAKFNYDAGDTTDSIIIILDVPAEYYDDARGSDGIFYAALWNTDSLRWDTLDNSVVAVDGKKVSVTTTHFSQYTLVRKTTSTKAEFMVKPNPFSPYVQPYRDYSRTAPLGTCLQIRATSAYKASLNLSVDIYNVLGDRVWSVTLQNVSSSREYKIFWDGKTTSKSIALGPADETDEGYFVVRGSRMCRNGRYFAVLTVDDDESKKQYTKQIVLFK